MSADARRRSVAVRALRPRPGAEPGTVRCALLSDVAAERDWVADQSVAALSRGRRRRRDGRRPPRCWCAATPTPPRSPRHCGRAGCPVEVVGLAGLLAVDEVADVVAMLRLVADPGGGRRGDAGAHRPALATRLPAISPRCGAARSNPRLTARRARPRVAEQIVAQAGARCRLPPAWPTPSRSRAVREAYSVAGYGRICALGRGADHTAGAPRSSGGRPCRRGAPDAGRRRRGARPDSVRR